MGENCVFSHIEALQPVKVKLCKYYEEGQCFKGNECTYIHTTVSQLEREISGFPGWFKTNEEMCNFVTIVRRNDNIKSGDMTQTIFRSTLHGRVLRNEYRRLKYPIFCQDRSMIESLLLLKKKVSDIDFSNEDLYI